MLLEKALEQIQTAAAEKWREDWLYELIDAYNSKYNPQGDRSRDNSNRHTQFKRVFRGEKRLHAETLLRLLDLVGIGLIKVDEN